MQFLKICVFYIYLIKKFKRFHFRISQELSFKWMLVPSGVIKCYYKIQFDFSNKCVNNLIIVPLLC